MDGKEANKYDEYLKKTQAKSQQPVAIIELYLTKPFQTETLPQ